MRVLLGMVGVLLLLVAVAGLVLAAACGLEAEDTALLQLEVEGFEAETPATPTVHACAACQECVLHDASVAESRSAVDTDPNVVVNDPIDNRYEREGTLEVSGAAGVQCGTSDARHDNLAANALRSGRFSGAPA